MAPNATSLISLAGISPNLFSMSLVRKAMIVRAARIFFLASVTDSFSLAVIKPTSKHVDMPDTVPSIFRLSREGGARQRDSASKKCLTADAGRNLMDIINPSCNFLLPIGIPEPISKRAQHPPGSFSTARRLAC
jgi:hypothetical protein